MISERTFIHRYTSFWQQALPMGAAVVKRINRSFAADFLAEPPEEAGSVRRDLTSEMALRLLAARVRGGRVGGSRLPRAVIAEAGRRAADFIRRQRGLVAGRLPGPTRREEADAGQIARWLAEFLTANERGQRVIPLPAFAGCGILAACQGDLFAGQTLYEMKANDGGFRLVDLRQLVVYGALNFAAPRYPIHRFGLLNPILGVFFRVGVEELVEVMAGRSSVDLFSDIVDFVSTERASA